MAKSGPSSSVVGRDSSRSSGTRARLIEAAVETLKAEGFAGSSARAIAERAGVNQGLIFYHFDSVANLLLAALDSVSARRMEHYGAAIDGIGSPTELIDVATAIFREDLDAGYVAVLVEMIAGASSTPGLGPAVSARLGPWFAFAERAVDDHVGAGIGVGRAAGRRRLRDRCPVSRPRDADPSRRRSCQSARSLRPRQEAGRPAGDVRPAGGNEATMTDTISSEVPPARRPTDSGLDVVTGAFSYSGASLARALLASGRQVRTLTGHGGRAPATTAIDVRPLDFDDHLGLVASLAGATTLYNTYWVRFGRRTRRSRAGRRQLEGALPGRQAGRGRADRAREHHAPQQQLALAVFPGQGAGGARPRRERRLVRHRSPSHPLRR